MVTRLPRRRYHVGIDLHADDQAELVLRLRQIATAIENDRRGPMSGAGVHHGYVAEVRVDPEMDHAAFVRRLERMLYQEPCFG